MLKISQLNTVVDFSDPEVRRLHGILLEMKYNAENAIKEMNRLKIDNKNITLSEMISKLDYYLQMLGINGR